MLKKHILYKPEKHEFFVEVYRIKRNKAQQQNNNQMKRNNRIDLPYYICVLFIFRAIFSRKMFCNVNCDENNLSIEPIQRDMFVLHGFIFVL